MSSKQTDVLSSGSGLDNESKETTEDWKSSVLSRFKVLSPKEQMDFFSSLLGQASAEVRYNVFKEVKETFHRDIMLFLPLEIQEHLCHYIDVKSLLQATRVSKGWNRAIDSLSKVWKRKYCLLGNKLKENEEKDWKAACLQTLKLRTALSNGTGFHHRNITGLCLSSEQITGLDFLKDLLVACANDRIGVWSTKDYSLITIFTVPYRVSCLKIDIGNILACGHTSGHLTTWSLNCSELGSRPASRFEYRGHTGVIMTISMSAEIDLLVSGATDYTAKLWSISTGQLVKTIRVQSRWVIQVTLLPVINGKNPKTLSQDKNALLIKTRDIIKILSWNAYFECCPYGDVSAIEDSVVQYPLESINNFQTPGCCIQNGHLIYIAQSLVKSGEPGDAELLFENLEINECTKKIPLECKVRKLLAVGDKFAFVLLPNCDIFTPNLRVIDIDTGEILGGTTIPHSSSSTPNLAQIVVGDEEWLSDLSQLSHKGAIIAAGLFHGQIRVITWNDPNGKLTG